MNLYYRKVYKNLSTLNFKMKIYLGSDHAGFELKENMKKFLTKKNIEFEDLGNLKFQKEDDYPDYAAKVARKVAKDKTKGILFCGSSHGMAIAANKIKGIRAVSASDVEEARKNREHNDANVLALGGWNFNEEKVEKIILTWLKTPFPEVKRHKRRVDKIKRLER